MKKLIISSKLLDYIKYEYLDNEREELKQLKMNEFKTKVNEAINISLIPNFEIEWEENKENYDTKC